MKFDEATHICRDLIEKEIIQFDFKANEPDEVYSIKLFILAPSQSDSLHVTNIGSPLFHENFRFTRAFSYSEMVTVIVFNALK